MPNDIITPVVITIHLGNDAESRDGRIVIVDNAVERLIEHRNFSFAVDHNTFKSLLDSLDRFKGTKGIIGVTTNIP